MTTPTVPSEVAEAMQRNVTTANSFAARLLREPGHQEMKNDVKKALSRMEEDMRIVAVWLGANLEMFLQDQQFREKTAEMTAIIGKMINALKEKKMSPFGPGYLGSAKVKDLCEKVRILCPKTTYAV